MAPDSLLASIHAPEDLRGLTPGELETLAAEIRQLLITSVAQTGGHLGPNLGVVELTLAIHRVFDSPSDPVIFDTGHQSYVHKLITGRSDLSDLRQRGGLSGYPSRAESVHDWVENSHASASLSWAEGMAKGLRLRGEPGTVVAVVGDGALTGGMTWEALNNISVQPELPLVIVVNDNGRSYLPTVGGMTRMLDSMRTDHRYERTLDLIKRTMSRTPIVGRPAYDLLHAVKTALKDVLAPQALFADLGLKYLGPIDGHDLARVEQALQQARDFGGPVVVHCLTVKGKGFRPAEDHEEDRFHAVGQIDCHTGEPLSTPTPTTWTDVFAEHLVTIGHRRSDVVALTAAMLHPTGLNRFAMEFPDRCFDVGIAEQHAVTSAAGLAAAGLHPVVAIYATFLNRAFDQLLMDVALHQAGVTVVLDRAGITGTDGASHNGMWDMSILQVIPGLHLAAPRDATRLREALDTAVTIDDAPSVVRFSKDQLPDDINAVAHNGPVDVLRSDADSTVLIVGVGQLVGTALEVADRLADQGIASTVVDPVWVLPVATQLLQLAAASDHVVTIEDNGVVGGVGDRLSHELAREAICTPVHRYGIAQEFLPHASRGELLTDLGLSAATITLDLLGRLHTDDAAPAAH